MEETVYKVSESEPSEREARETCERMRKMASSQKVPAPALQTSEYHVSWWFFVVSSFQHSKNWAQKIIFLVRPRTNKTRK